MRKFMKIIPMLILCYLPSSVLAQIATGIGVVNQDTVHVITWTDSDGLTGEAYNVYTSLSPITDVTAENVYRIGTRVPENEERFEYKLHTPGKPGTGDYFYAVTVDSNGFENPALAAGVNTTTIAETGHTRWAFPVIWLDGKYFQPPAIDANIGEWEPAFAVSLDPDSPENSVALGTIADSLDQSVTCWLAMDEDHIYIAGSATDDALVNPIAPGASDQWRGDVVEYYIGLYDQRPSDKPHDDYQVGAEPDYEIHIKANAGTDLLNTHIFDNGKANPSNLVWPAGEANAGGTGTNGNWNYEGKLPLSALTWDTNAFPSRFVPHIGMVLPINIMTCDADDPGASKLDLRQGQLSWSNHRLCKDSWTRPDVWIHQAVIYDPRQLQSVISGVKELPLDGKKPIPQGHGLFQNYPNPFNSETTIEYKLAESLYIRLELHDLLGRRVQTLLDCRQAAGTYRIQWDGRDEGGRDVTSGIYLCKMSAADMVKTKKVILLR